MSPIQFLSAAAGLALLSGCAMTSDIESAADAPATGAHAALYSPTGIAMGHATVEQIRGGLRVTVTVTGAALPPGPHGAHIHTVGKCDAPDFASAGGHWNPTAMQHGTLNPMGPHEGDLPNLIAGADGAGSITFDVPGAMLTGGTNPLLDADGAALVIHAAADDLKTDPSGNSGGRIACGVLAGG